MFARISRPCSTTRKYESSNHAPAGGTSMPRALASSSTSRTSSSTRSVSASLDRSSPCRVLRADAGAAFREIVLVGERLARAGRVGRHQTARAPGPVPVPPPSECRSTVTRRRAPRRSGALRDSGRSALAVRREACRARARARDRRAQRIDVARQICGTAGEPGVVERVDRAKLGELSRRELDVLQQRAANVIMLTVSGATS